MNTILASSQVNIRDSIRLLPTEYADEFSFIRYYCAVKNPFTFPILSAPPFCASLFSVFMFLTIKPVRSFSFLFIAASVLPFLTHFIYNSVNPLSDLFTALSPLSQSSLAQFTALSPLSQSISGSQYVRLRHVSQMFPVYH